MQRVSALLGILVLGATAPLEASFHFMEISEVMVGAGGDCRIQFVELRMTLAGQNFVRTHELFFFDAAGNPLGDFPLPENVTNGAEGSHILIGTQEFADASSVAPDFIMPGGLLMPHGGRVSFEGPTLAVAVDSLAYGIYSGDNGNHGSPAPALSVTGGRSLTRTSSVSEDAMAFELMDPSPTNNSGETGAISPPAPACFLEESFENLDRWDQPAENAGLDLDTCVPGAGVVDVGSVAVDGGKMLFIPGLVDNLDLGLPISLTGLKSEVAAEFAGEAGYRLRFDMRAQMGIVTGALFVAQHYGFDSARNVLDFAPARGMGINFTFDSVTETSDHLHPDVRVACLGEDSPTGPGNVPFGTFDVLVTETEYTVVLDVQGDDVRGPLTLAAKFFEKNADEPPEALATWTMPLGLDAPEDESLDHGILIAALGDQPAALEVSNLSICEIPRDQLPVRDLTCVRNFDGTVTVTWQNPAGVDGPIAVVLNGVEVERLEGDEDSIILDDVPGEELRFEVINSSCAPAACTVCFNRDPVAVVDGPLGLVLSPDGTATTTLTSAGSSDGDGGTQGITRFWELTGRPAGSNAFLDLVDLDGVEARLTVDTNGAYTVDLTVTDNGCSGDFLDTRSATASFVLEVGSPGVNFRRGDADDNGNLELTDAVRILNFLFLGGAAPACLDAADSDDNARIELTDAVVLLGFLFLGNRPPAEPLDCDVDPTEDDLSECVYNSC